MSRLGLGVLVTGLLVACGPGGEGEDAALRRGRIVYQTNCLACHNPDPAMEGTLGPAISSSSRALVEARVLRAEYPPGYEPKRDTNLMTPLPHLEPHIDALTLYLADPR